MGAIYLVRHGQASFGAADYDALSPRGFEQSTVVGVELLRREVSFSRAVSGTLARQRDTAATAMKVLGDLPVAEDDRWNEPPIGPEWAGPIAPTYFNWRKTTIYGGTNEIQKNIIAKAILGL